MYHPDCLPCEDDGQLYYDSLEELEMALIVKDTGGGDFPKAPAGTHFARCYMVVDLGMQATAWGPKHKIFIGWELPDELMEDGRPFVVSNQYTASLSEKANLRHHLESWRGKQFTEQELGGFDLFDVLGHPCMVSVVHNHKDGNTYANIAGVSSCPKGMPIHAPINEPVKLSLDNFDEEAFQKLPEWLQKKINRAPPEVSEVDFDDDIPF